MIKSLVGAVETMARKPLVFVPGIVFILIDFIFRYILEDQAIESSFLFLDFLSVPVFGLQRMPFQMIASYPGEIIFLGLFVAASTVIGTMFSVSVANYVFEKKSALISVIYSVKSLMKIILFVLFFGLILVFSAIVLWIAMLFALAAGIIGTIIFLLLITLMGFVLVHFVFVPALMGKGMNIKQAFTESWKITGKNFFEVLLLLIGIALIQAGINQAYMILLDSSFGESDLMILAGMVFSLIGLTYTNIVFPLFYLNKTK